MPGFAVVGVVWAAAATLYPNDEIGIAVTAPGWLLAVLPLLIGGPLFLRRRAPLLMWVLVWLGISVQALTTHQPPRGPELVFGLCAGSYALAAYASLGRAVAGLAVAVPGLMTTRWPATRKRSEWRPRAPCSAGKYTAGPGSWPPRLWCSG